MKLIPISLLSILIALCSTPLKAQQLISPAGGESPMAIWALGEVLGGSYQTKSLFVTQGVLTMDEVDNPDGIIENETSRWLRIWPNPVIDKLHLSITNQAFPLLITVFSSKGAAEMTQTLREEQASVPLSRLAPGSYYVRLSDNNGHVLTTQKIIKL